MLLLPSGTATAALYAEHWLNPGSSFSLSIDILMVLWLCPSVCMCQMASRGAAVSLGRMELLLEFGWIWVGTVSQMMLKENISLGNTERKGSENYLCTLYGVSQSDSIIVRMNVMLWYHRLKLQWDF